MDDKRRREKSDEIQTEGDENIFSPTSSDKANRDDYEKDIHVPLQDGEGDPHH